MRSSAPKNDESSIELQDLKILKKEQSVVSQEDCRQRRPSAMEFSHIDETRMPMTEVHYIPTKNTGQYGLTRRDRAVGKLEDP